MAPSSTAPNRQRLWARRAALGALVLATSLAVASYASVWLVPPYLALMAWLLWPLVDWRVRAIAVEGSDASESLRTEELDEGFVESSATSWNDATLSEASLDASAAAEADSATATTALKTKRGRSRGRKAKPALAVEPATQVTWIRVGPGKFVRVEGAEPQATDDAPSAEVERDLADVAPVLPSFAPDAPSDEVETAPAVPVEPDASALVEAPEAGTVEDAPAEALGVHRHQPPECTVEASEPPEAADVPEVSCVDDPETPALPDEVVEEIEPEPEPEVAVDLVDVPAEGDGPDSDATIADDGTAGLGFDTCENLVDVPSLTPLASSLPDGPSTRSAGHSLWGALRAVCPHLTGPFRAVAKRSPSRRATRAGRWVRVMPILRQRSRRGQGRRAWRALHARSPPAEGVPPHRANDASPAPNGLSAALCGVRVVGDGTGTAVLAASVRIG